MTRILHVPAHDGGSFLAYLALPASGKGPGLVLAQEIFGLDPGMHALAEAYAEEGYAVLVPDLFRRRQAGIEPGHGETGSARAPKGLQGFDFDVEHGIADLQSSLDLLRGLPEVDAGAGLGVVGYGLGGRLAYLAASRTDAAVSVGYYATGLAPSPEEAAGIRGRLLLHFAGRDSHCPAGERERIAAVLGGRGKVELHTYPDAGHAFAEPGGAHYDKLAAMLALQRTIAALKRELGPHYDLEALWERHCACEFAARDVDATMATMVAEPYVNHVPTMTGGVGYHQLYRFYKHHFVHANPADMTLAPVSRTIGSNQLVDEFVLGFTHSCEIDWLLPGVAPTGRRVEVPMLAVVRFRGDKLCHEHIYWDQASVLVQVGLLDPQGLPVAGAETARKLVDESLPSNRLMARWKNSEGG